MPLSVRSIALLGLPLASIAQARNLPDVTDVSGDRAATWLQKLVSASGEQGHLQPERQERVFEDGNQDPAAVDSEHVGLTSKSVDLARQDALVKEYLRKRQDNNATTTALATETLSTEAPTQLSSSQGQSSTSSSSARLSEAQSLTTIVETSVVIETVLPTIVTVPAGSSTIEVPATTTQPSTSEQTRDTTTQPPTTQTGILVPIITTATANDGSVVVTTTNAFETTAQTSIVVDQTTTNDSGETIVTSATAPATIVTQTNSEGSTMVTTSPVSVVSVAPGGSVIEPSGGMLTTTDQEGITFVLSRPTSAGTFTMTDPGGRVATVTYQPGGGTVSQVHVLTTTLANGQRSTITSFAEVGVETGADSAPQATGGSESGEQPGLQSGAGFPSSCYAAGVALVAGAMMGAALLA